MGLNGGENVKTLLLLHIAAKSVQMCSDFFPNGPHKTTLGFFEILSFRFLIGCFRKFTKCQLF